MGVNRVNQGGFGSTSPAFRSSKAEPSPDKREIAEVASEIPAGSAALGSSVISDQTRSTSIAWIRKLFPLSRSDPVTVAVGFSPRDGDAGGPRRGATPETSAHSSLVSGE